CRSRRPERRTLSFDSDLAPALSTRVVTSSVGRCAAHRTPLACRVAYGGGVLGMPPSARSPVADPATPRQRFVPRPLRPSRVAEVTGSAVLPQAPAQSLCKRIEVAHALRLRVVFPLRFLARTAVAAVERDDPASTVSWRRRPPDRFEPTGEREQAGCLFEA